MTAASVRSLSAIQSEARQSLEEALASGTMASMLPSRADESWRKVDIDLVPFASLAATFRPGATQTISRQNVATRDEEERLRLESMLGELAQSDGPGAVSHPYDVRDTHASFFRKDIFTALNLAYARPLVLSMAGSATSSEQSTLVEIDHTTEAGASSFPSCILSVPAGANITIIERYRGTGTIDAPLLHCGHTVIVAQEGATVRYLQVREHGEGDFHFHHARFLLHRDSNVHASVLHSGGLLGKGFFQASLLEPGATFRGTGLFAGRGGQTHHMEMGVQHLSDHGSSSLLYKTVLSDRSHSVFLGSLEVPTGIRKVDSLQLNHNLILSKRARAESRPWLLIRAEDVGCEHGATVGDLDEDALFFLKSRGLPDTEARRLLIQGFFEEVIGELPLPEEAKEEYRSSLMSTVA